MKLRQIQKKLIRTGISKRFFSFKNQNFSDFNDFSQMIEFFEELSLESSRKQKEMIIQTYIRSNQDNPYHVNKIRSISF